MAISGCTNLEDVEDGQGKSSQRYIGFPAMGRLKQGLLYGFRKIDKHLNFQPTKSHLNDVFYFSTTMTIKLKITTFLFNISGNFAINIFGNVVNIFSQHFWKCC
jgi:hypothetical protein